MLFKKEKNIQSIFSHHYKIMLRIVKRAKFSDLPEFELLSAMYAVGDIASIFTPNARITVHNKMFAEIRRIATHKYDSAKFRRRKLLYNEIIRGKKLHGYWYTENINELSKDPTDKCTFLLIDILLNPNCADNYDNASVINYNSTYYQSFIEKVVQPLHLKMLYYYYELRDYLSDIYNN